MNQEKWSYCRLHLKGAHDTCMNTHKMQWQLLDIGNGKMAIDESTECITLPTLFCKITANWDELIEKSFPNIAQTYKNHQLISERAILAAKINDVNAINFSIQNEVPDEATTYKSIDTVMNPDKVVNYPNELLNSPDLSDMPSHVLTFKMGSISSFFEISIHHNFATVPGFQLKKDQVRFRTFE